MDNQEYKKPADKRNSGIRINGMKLTTLLILMSIVALLIGGIFAFDHYLTKVYVEEDRSLWIQLLARSPLVLFAFFIVILTITNIKRSELGMLCLVIALFSYTFYLNGISYLLDLCTNETVTIEVTDYHLGSRASKHNCPYYLSHETFADKLANWTKGDKAEVVISKNRYDEIKSKCHESKDRYKKTRENYNPPLRLEVYRYSRFIKTIVYLQDTTINIKQQ